MGNNLFGANISGKVAAALGSKLLAATLVKRTPGTRTTTARDAGTNPTESRHTARGIVEEYSATQIDGTLVRRGDRRVLLLADTIAGRKVPAQNDSIVIEGQTYVVVAVTRDPDAATFTCQVRAQ